MTARDLILGDPGHELEHAVGAGLHGPEPALHVAHHLQQEDVAEDERRQRDERQDDDHLDGGDLPVGQIDGQQ